MLIPKEIPKGDSFYVTVCVKEEGGLREALSPTGSTTSFDTGTDPDPDPDPDPGPGPDPDPGPAPPCSPQGQ